MGKMSGKEEDSGIVDINVIKQQEELTIQI